MRYLVKADLTNEKHGEAILSVLDSYATGVMGGGEKLSHEVRETLIMELEKLPHCHVLLSYEDEIPAGVAICFEGFSTFACRKILNIHDFAVAPDFQGQGVARALLDKVEELARKLDCCKLTLEVLEGNERAQKVYRAFGFAGYELDPEMGRALFFEKKL